MTLVIVSSVFLTFVIIAYFFKRRKSNRYHPSSISKPLIIAHRGASGTFPENTHVAFQAAVEHGADYLEFDIQLSKDQEFVVIHDQTLERTTNGKGKVSDYMLNQLETLDAGAWKGAKFSGERIPTLTEVLNKYHKKIKLLIEVKHSKNHRIVAELLAEQLKLFSFEEKRIIVQSFDYEFLNEFKKQMPEMPLGILIRHQYNGIKNQQLRDYATFADFINPKITMASENLITRIHEHHANCIFWTIKNKQQAQKILKLNPNGIATDYPEWFK